MATQSSSANASANGALATDVTYEDLIDLEHAFDDAELAVLRAQTAAFAPLYARRAAVVGRIPNFWPLALEQAPPELDQYIQPSDSALFAECLLEISVDRFDDDSPRSFRLAMRFDAGKNRWFEDETVSKDFHWRRARDGWSGLVSEPVRVRWKQGQDLTAGLTDAACGLWAARQRVAGADADDAGAERIAALPEHKALVAKLEDNDPAAASFFTLFGFVSERRYVSAAESAAATEALRKKRHDGDAAAAESESAAAQSEEAEARRMAVEQDAEICPHGADVASVVAEDLFPDAIRYFTSAQEQEDADVLSDDGFEEDDDEAEDDDEGEEEIDIRALVKGKGKGKAGGAKREKRDNSDGDGADSRPPAKSRRTGE